MRNCTGKSSRENPSTNIVFNNFSFSKIVHLLDIVEKYDKTRHATNDNIVRSMRFACWITKATDASSECIILTAFRRQGWVNKRASLLCYTYIACLVSLNKVKQLAFLAETSDLLARCAQLRTFQKKLQS